MLLCRAWHSCSANRLELASKRGRAGVPLGVRPSFCLPCCLLSAQVVSPDVPVALKQTVAAVRTP